MGLWKHGVEQILAVAGMQNQETKRKTLARQISTKVRRGAMCSPSRKPQKRGHTFNRFIRRARERVTENRDSSNGPFHGRRSANGRAKELRHDGVATCYEKRGKTQPKTAEGGK